MTLADRSIGAYLEALGAPRRAPYGGVAAGLCAAQAAALTLAIARHAGVRTSAVDSCTDLVAEALDLMERDAAAVDRMLAASARPRDGHGDDAARPGTVATTVADTVDPQVGIVRLCAALVDQMRDIVGGVTPGVVADLAAAVQLARTAVVVARANIVANAARIDDGALGERCTSAASDAAVTLAALDELAAAGD